MVSTSLAVVAVGVEGVADSVEADQAAFDSPVGVALLLEPQLAPLLAPSLRSVAVPVPVSSEALASLVFHRLQKEEKETLKGGRPRNF